MGECTVEGASLLYHFGLRYGLLVMLIRIYAIIEYIIK